MTDSSISGFMQQHTKTPVLITAVCLLMLLFSPWYPAGHPFDRGHDYVTLHTAMEFIAISISLLIFAVIWNSNIALRNGNMILLAIAFFCIGLIDFAHVMNFKGMPDFITPYTSGKAIYFWLAGRMVAALALIGIALSAWEMLQHKTARRLFMLAGISVVAYIYWIVLFRHNWLPPVFIEGQGLTPFKVYSEYVISALYLLAAALLLASRSNNHYSWQWLAAAAAILGLGELYFTLYQQVTDIYNFLGHVYKAVAYLMIYKAVFVLMVKQPYIEIAQLQSLQNESETRYRTLVSNLPGMVFRCEVSPPWRMEFISDAARQITGYIPETFMNEHLNYADIVLQDDLPRLEHVIEQALHGCHLYDIDYRIRHADGSIRWVHERGHINFDTGGNNSWIDGVIMDISAQQETERKFRTLVETSNDWIWEIDQHCIYTYSSPRCLDILGYTPEQLLGKKCTDFMPADEVPALERLLSAQQPFHLQLNRHLHINGSLVTLETSGAPIFSTLGELLGYRGIARDVTDRLLAQQREALMTNQLNIASRMEAIGMLTGGIAHDFNNILGAIYGYGELLKHALGADAKNPQAAQRYVEEIIKASERAKQLIAQMLAFSRSASADAAETPPVIQLLPVIKEVSNLLRAAIPSTISLYIHAEQQYQTLSAAIQPIKLHQVLLNLGVNARDAIGEYGSIYIRLGLLDVHGASCASCKQTLSGKFAEICVEDSGAGIPQEVMGKLFNPFFTTKDVGKGTGLGLPVVHGVVHDCGGHIVVNTQPGKGTTMCVLLPLADGAQADNRIPALANAPLKFEQLRGLRIMVVDDEQAIASMLQELLSIHGAIPASYTSSQQALQDFSAHPENYDLLITDETMPRLSGLHMAAQMLKLKPELPVLLCTGYSSQVNADVAREAGVSAFLYKPVDHNLLLNTLVKLSAQN